MALLAASLRPMMVSFCISYGVLPSRIACLGKIADAAAFEKPSCRCLGTESVARSPDSSWTYHWNGRVSSVSVYVCMRSSWPQPLLSCHNLSVLELLQCIRSKVELARSRRLSDSPSPSLLQRCSPRQQILLIFDLAHDLMPTGKNVFTG